MPDTEIGIIPLLPLVISAITFVMAVVSFLDRRKRRMYATLDARYFSRHSATLLTGRVWRLEEDAGLPLGPVDYPVREGDE